MKLPLKHGLYLVYWILLDPSSYQHYKRHLEVGVLPKYAVEAVVMFNNRYK